MNLLKITKSGLFCELHHRHAELMHENPKYYKTYKLQHQIHYPHRKFKSPVIIRSYGIMAMLFKYLHNSSKNND